MTDVLDVEPATPPAPPKSTSRNGKRPADERINWKSSMSFFGAMMAGIAGIVLMIIEPKWHLIRLAAALFLVRMFLVTAIYHRYLSHKAFKMNRFWAFVFTFATTSCAQKGPIWWAGWHRHHHRFSDTERDVHSPKKGFWWSHMGWIVCDKFSPMAEGEMKEYNSRPEILWVERHNALAPWILASACFLWAASTRGWSGGIWPFIVAGGIGLLVGYFTSTFFLWHSTFTINSLSHVWGKRVYETEDTSRNNPYLAILTGGEGWHNNHHRYPNSARQGFRWYQIDVTYYILWVLSKLRIVSDLKRVPKYIIEEGYGKKPKSEAKAA